MPSNNNMKIKRGGAVCGFSRGLLSMAVLLLVQGLPITNNNLLGSGIFVLAFSYYNSPSLSPTLRKQLHHQTIFSRSDTMNSISSHYDNKRYISSTISSVKGKNEKYNLLMELQMTSGSEDDGDTLEESKSANNEKEDSSSTSTTKTLDRVLSRLTSAFPLFVVLSAVLGVVQPSCLLWVDKGNLISIMLAAVMCGTGLTLDKSDFAEILSRKNIAVVPLGVLCQFTIMPLAASIVGRTFILSSSAAGVSTPSPENAALFLGLCLVGCAPGGTASNLVSLIAGADVALSVILTTCSTLLAVVATPLLVQMLVSSSVRVSGLALCKATAQVVFLPVLLGMLLKGKFPQFAEFSSRFTPFISVLLVALICGGVVAQNASTLVTSAAVGGGGGGSLFLRMGLSVLLLHVLGFAVGYSFPRYAFRQNEKRSRTISIEVGMQNSALAVVLARSIGAHPLAALPGAISATTHSCLGSILAAFWRIRGQKDEESTSELLKDEDGMYRVKPSGDEAPEFLI